MPVGAAEIGRPSLAGAAPSWSWQLRGERGASMKRDFALSNNLLCDLDDEIVYLSAPFLGRVIFQSCIES